MDFAGIKIGHATWDDVHTGCTVFLCPAGTVGAVDTRGPAPGSRETALLQPDKPNHFVNGVLLTGGSALGLAAADGVVGYLAERNIGHETPVRPIPIVPAAVVYDLFFGRGVRTPNAALGYEACRGALLENGAQGNIGAGAGVTVGKWAAGEGVMKGGFGLAGDVVDGITVAAAAVVNAIGDVMAADGTVLAGARGADGGWLADQDPYRRFRRIPGGGNTTLVVVATDARLDRVQAHRLAQRAHDGMAMAIYPVHTTHDGDTAFALSTGRQEANFDLVANVAVRMVAEAIRNGVRHAATVDGVPGLADGA